MNTNGRPSNDEPNVAASFAGLTHDAIELAELQTQLLALDVKSISEKARTSLILGLIGIALLMGTVPVGLIAIGEALAQWFGWSHAAGLAVATLVGILITAGLLGAAWSRFHTGLATMQRSRDEFNRNVAWVKSNLRGRAQRDPADTDRF